jgi:two-component sensor histidine kinase
MFTVPSREDLGGDDVVDGPLPDRTVEELLRLETHHRLMNTFAILCAILQRELNTLDPRSRMALDRSVRIITAHSALHRCLVAWDAAVPGRALRIRHQAFKMPFRSGFGANARHL